MNEVGALLGGCEAYKKVIKLSDSVGMKIENLTKLFWACHLGNDNQRKALSNLYQMNNQSGVREELLLKVHAGGEGVLENCKLQH